MAALELHCGPDPGGRGWGGERVDLLDSFDSEMQEWEDQLQEMQRKIEELYNEVKARREANETNTNDITNNKSLDFTTLLPVNLANGYPSGCPNSNLPVHQCKGVGGDPSVIRSFGFPHLSNNCNGSNNYMLNPLSKCSQNPNSCHNIGNQDATLDILNGYLQQRPQLGNSQRNLGAPNTVFPVSHSYQDSMKTSPGTNRTASGIVVEELEEDKNKKKKASLDESQACHVSWKDQILSNNLPPKNSASKQPVKQRNASPVPPRSPFHESSQQPDRKCLLIDRKCGSPSVLRKFGAMLQENEGKTLIEDGLMTTLISTELPKHASTTVCQSKFDARRVSTQVPIQKCIADCDKPMVELEPGQDPSAAFPPQHLLHNGDRHSEMVGSAPEQYGLAFNLSPSQSYLKAGYHKKGPGHKSHKAGFQGEDLFSDYQLVEPIVGAGSQHYGKVHTGLCVDLRWQNDNLDQLLEMMEIENYRSQRDTFTQQLDTKQVIRESSPVPIKSNFSRPSRPANQRRPSRWAKHTLPSTIPPTSCPPSPSLKAKQFLNSYSLHTETVIM
ncbi:uncharacterized protein LOC127624817 [Xyrauchen texanus]|uniref:uncharacterized protein LOC127624817 n=1 Tax=Xyrauchen texanus TaxID=154827 RepID=UPI002241CFB8|nr:uncharacterized protein LOC127624817 [Xyrauchen texanus]XP_051955714.1 uncharacterized protein LOC127624817 [Xyrauchen texanus]XP_051955715.1 uncharacterized protein LOC127624817 [Xyrauchen texanus]